MSDRPPAGAGSTTADETTPSSADISGDKAADAAAAEAVGGRPSRARNALGLIVSLISLGAVGWWASSQDAPTFPTDARHLAVLAAGVGVYTVLTAIRGWRWHHVLGLASVPHRARDAYGLTVVGYMGNTVFPARGGELLRIVLMGERAGGRRREILGSIIAERLLDLGTLAALFVFITWAGIAGTPLGQAPAMAAAAGAVACALALAAYVRLRQRGRMDRFARLVRPFVRASRLLWGRMGLLLIAATLAVWWLETLNFWLVARALELDLGPVDALFLVVLVSLAAAIPAGPGYLGTFDAALVFGLDALGASGSASLSFVLLVRFVIFVPITVAGVAFLFALYGGMRRLTPTR